MNNSYSFTHKNEYYDVEWEEENKILILTFKKDGELLKTRSIPLLGSIDQTQLDQIVNDYWKSFVNKELKDIID
jgi:hypothetical protein